MHKIELVKNILECCGCGACYIICPKNAISMQENEYGYKYPVIDNEACIKCGKCIKICKYKNRQGDSYPLRTYAAHSRDKKLESNSTSGGVFASLAKSILKKGGFIAGAVMDINTDQVTVYHKCGNSMDDLYQMQGSKYVQSNAWESYKDIIKKLEAKENVLFCGTPCQVEAIKALTENPEYLYTIDLVCHGVSSAKMLQEFLMILGKSLGGKIQKFSFRDKKCKKEFCSSIFIKKHNLYIGSHYLSYYKFFLEGDIYRENCYSCPYANINRVGDITIGDYWGIKKVHSNEIQSGEINLDYNWSCILVNTEKGRELLEKHGSGLQLVRSSINGVVAENGQLKHPSSRPERRDSMLQIYREKGYLGLEKWFRKNNGGNIRFRWRLLKEIYHNYPQKNQAY